MILSEILTQANKYGEILTLAVISLITLAIALPLQAKAAQSKALETVQKVYSGMIGDLRKEVDALKEELNDWKQKHNDSHCENAKTCKTRKK